MRNSQVKKTPASRKRSRKLTPGLKTDRPEELFSGERTPAPTSPKPMQATRVTTPVNDPKYLYEVKWDGYRIMSLVRNGKVKLFSRKGLDYTSRYPAVEKAVSKMKHDAVLDGEVVVLNDEGRPDFDALQRYREGDPVYYYVFDILWLDGYSLIKLPLVKRRKLLERVIPAGTLIRLSESFEDGVALFEKVKELKLEGIVAKERNSPYEPGKRVDTWYKVPAEIRQEFVIGGWTESENKRSFRSLLFGYFEGKQFHYAGHAGGGFKDAEMPGILKKLKTLERASSPFDGPVETDAITHWVKPQLVAEIKFATKTASGKIRKPAIFFGFREDKKPAEVVKELDVIPGEQTDLATSTGSNWGKIENAHITERENVHIEGVQLQLTNISRELWRGITKAHLIAYYIAVSEYILPHLKNRPLSLHLKPNAAMTPGFYIKDMEGRAPEFAGIYSTTRKHHKKGSRDQLDYLVCNNLPTLVYAVNLGCIDINPWSATTLHPDQPNYISIDLDPTGDVFSEVIEAALAARQVLTQHRLVSFIKTSGKTGMHVFLPCSGFTFKEARMLSELLAEEIHALVPSITTTEVSIHARGKKVYLDPNQNDEADTLASAYSVRPYHLPLVSTPIDWKEVNSRLDPHAFTIDTIRKRLEKKGDLFLGVLEAKNAGKNNKVFKKIMGERTRR